MKNISKKSLTKNNMSFKQSKWVAFRFSFNLAIIILIKIIFPSTDIALMMATSALMTACIAVEKNNS